MKEHKRETRVKPTVAQYSGTSRSETQPSEKRRTRESIQKSQGCVT